MLNQLSHIPRANMLEMGCGTGHWTEFFVEQGFKVTAADISEAMLNHAKNKNIKAEFQPIDTEVIPFDDHQFDTVAAITMLEFVDNQQKTLEELCRVLKPEGWLILGCLNADSELGKQKNNNPTFEQAQFYTEKQLIETLSVFGQVHYSTCLHYSPNFEILDNTPSAEKFAGAFMLACIQKHA
jgi:ubiquinone/menaquinone biosynthesis C-methylase UbiE